ncbi:MAG: TetR/AcrR family transcriptional regulator [Chloroflexota bacterium]
MRQRAELVDQTRQRITEATARLHTTIGPAATSISGIAEEAGVTRVTVYRHFPDLDVLFQACRAHWREQHPPPDARAWPAIPGLADRARHALTELYGWYREHAESLYPIYRDMTSMPRSSQDEIRATNAWLGDQLVEGHTPKGDPGRRLRAVARHLVDYPTWRSLAIELGLGDDGAANVGVRLLTAMSSVPPDEGRGRRASSGRSAAGGP